MSLPHIIQHLPNNHPNPHLSKNTLHHIIQTISPYQHKHTPLSYHILHNPHTSHNSLETSRSSLYIYAIPKRINQGYLHRPYQTTLL
ncbi:glycoside hydrolase family 88 protein, partial [Bacillus subtilis]|uniref:glycoside hydrolase family 88 protein n=1 Tax=Bacillus subtilis TaxID=1423 RepID=UPI00338EFDC3